MITALRNTIEQQRDTIEHQEEDIAGLTRRVAELHEANRSLTEQLSTAENKLFEWETNDILFFRQQTTPFYYIPDNITLTISTTITNQQPAFVKPKNRTDVIYYVPDYNTTDWPTNLFDVGIVNTLMLVSTYTKENVLHYTKSAVREIAPTVQPTGLDIPNYAAISVLNTDVSVAGANTWIYTKIRIKTSNGYLVVCTEKDHNWWWLESRDNIEPI